MLHIKDSGDALSARDESSPERQPYMLVYTMVALCIPPHCKSDRRAISLSCGIATCLSSGLSSNIVSPPEHFDVHFDVVNARTLVRLNADWVHGS